MRSMMLAALALAGCLDGTPNPDSLRVDQEEATVAVGDSTRLTAHFADGEDGSYASWDTEDPLLVRVAFDESGAAEVTGLAAGTATVFAYFRSVRRDVAVTVVAP